MEMKDNGFAEDGSAARSGREVNESLHVRVLQELRLDSSLGQVPTLARGDVEIQSLLGSGSFAQVFTVSVNAQSCGAGWTEDANEEANVGAWSGWDDSPVLQVSQHSTSTCSSRSSGQRTVPHKYAIKMIRKDFQDDPVMATAAVRDFCFEAEILSHLPQHPHIVNLLAANNGFEEKPDFVILERVSETLKHRIARWSRSAKNNKASSSRSLFRNMFQKQPLKELHDQRDRLYSSAMGIASAFKFLHEHSIVYRDLKPANVGFTYDGTVKLFDFGLARRYIAGEDQRRLTGGCGTARYTAPEVSNHEDYALPADVYSYAILLWEICTLERPFHRYSSLQKLKQKVVDRHRRPSLGKIASPTIRNLLKACWDPDPRVRPTFAAVLMGVEEAVGLAQ